MDDLSPMSEVDTLPIDGKISKLILSILVLQTAALCVMAVRWGISSTVPALLASLLPLWQASWRLVKPPVSWGTRQLETRHAIFCQRRFAWVTIFLGLLFVGGAIIGRAELTEQKVWSGFAIWFALALNDCALAHETSINRRRALANTPD